MSRHYKFIVGSESLPKLCLDNAEPKLPCYNAYLFSRNFTFTLYVRTPGNYRYCCMSGHKRLCISVVKTIAQLSKWSLLVTWLQQQATPLAQNLCHPLPQMEDADHLQQLSCVRCCTFPGSQKTARRCFGLPSKYWDPHI